MLLFSESSPLPTSQSGKLPLSLPSKLPWSWRRTRPILLQHDGDIREQRVHEVGPLPDQGGEQPQLGLDASHRKYWI